MSSTVTLWLMPQFWKQQQQQQQPAASEAKKGCLGDAVMWSSAFKYKVLFGEFEIEQKLCGEYLNLIVNSSSLFAGPFFSSYRNTESRW